MAEAIWVCFSGGGAGVAEVAALPVVLLSVLLEPVLLSAAAGFALFGRASLDWALFIVLPLRSSAFRSLLAAPLSLVSALMLFEFSPFMLSWADFSGLLAAFRSSWARCFLLLCGGIFSS